MVISTLMVCSLVVEGQDNRNRHTKTKPIVVNGIGNISIMPELADGRYQYELGFPEYKFHVGDVVMLINTDRYEGIPFRIKDRQFRDPRAYSEVDNDYRMRRTQWYYNLVSVNKMQSWDEEYHYKHRTSYEDNLERFSWERVDSEWEA